MTLLTVLLLGLALALAVLAGTLDIATWGETALWLAALLVGSLGLVSAYAVGITWARRRKRLWG
jgi:hypothetical protein